MRQEAKGSRRGMVKWPNFSGWGGGGRGRVVECSWRLFTNSLSHTTRTACYPKVAPLIGAQIDNQDSNSQLTTWPSTQSSSEPWRSGQLLWSAVALSSTALEPPSKVANGDTDTQVCRSDVYCFWAWVTPVPLQPVSSLFFLRREILKTQASWGHKMGELYISGRLQRTESSPPSAPHLAPNLNKSWASAVLSHWRFGLSLGSLPLVIWKCIDTWHQEIPGNDLNYPWPYGEF